MKARRADAPSKAFAAEFLREIARNAAKPAADPVQRARDLHLVADCIEGRVRWAKGGYYTAHQLRQIHLAARMIDNRPHGQSVKVATNNWIRNLSGICKADTEQAERRLRRAILDARTLRQKARTIDTK